MTLTRRQLLQSTASGFGYVAFSALAMTVLLHLEG